METALWFSLGISWGLNAVLTFRLAEVNRERDLLRQLLNKRLIDRVKERQAARTDGTASTAENTHAEG